MCTKVFGSNFFWMKIVTYFTYFIHEYQNLFCIISGLAEEPLCQKKVKIVVPYYSGFRGERNSAQHVYFLYHYKVTFYQQYVEIHTLYSKVSTYCTCAWQNVFAIRTAPYKINWSSVQKIWKPAAVSPYMQYTSCINLDKDAKNISWNTPFNKK